MVPVLAWLDQTDSSPATASEDLEEDLTGWSRGYPACSSWGQRSLATCLPDPVIPDHDHAEEAADHVDHAVHAVHVDHVDHDLLLQTEAACSDQDLHDDHQADPSSAAVVVAELTSAVASEVVVDASVVAASAVVSSSPPPDCPAEEEEWVPGRG